MLCRFGQLQSSSVFTHFHSYSSTATNSATSEYGTIRERISQNEEPTRTKNELGTLLVPA